MGGGPSTPALAAAVAEAGGLGFLAAGYKTVEAVRADVETLRALTDRPFGINLFAPPAPRGRRERVRGGARGRGRALRRAGRGAAPRRRRLGGEARADGRAGGAGRLLHVRLPVARRARALRRDLGDRDHARRGAEAAAAGASALVVQGVEAGGHRGSFDDAAPGEIGLLALLQLIDVDVPLVATGGIAGGRGVAAVLAAGASAAQLGPPSCSVPRRPPCPPSRRDRGARRHRADPRVHRPHGARHRQPLDARARRSAPAPTPTSTT